jgi:pimeloyl-ACP methyl ester carboxylesterase
MFVPLIDLLSPYFTVIAPDTPGYGLSDPLPTQPQTLADYLPYFKAFIHFISLKHHYTITPVALYGTATGAQLGIAYTYTYPDDVAHLFLDNAAHFEDAERLEITKDYFPDLTPQADGSHLKQVWDMANRFFVYFPWFKNDDEHRVSDSLPSLNIINTAAMEFLQAGPNYAAAYRAAFDHEKAENLAKVTVPTTLFRWKGAILLKYIDQLLASGLNDNVLVVETEAAMPDRYRAIVEAMKVGLLNG